MNSHGLKLQSSNAFARARGSTRRVAARLRAASRFAWGFDPGGIPAVVSLLYSTNPAVFQVGVRFVD